MQVGRVISAEGVYDMNKVQPTFGRKARTVFGAAAVLCIATAGCAGPGAVPRQQEAPEGGRVKPPAQTARLFPAQQRVGVTGRGDPVARRTPAADSGLRPIPRIMPTPGGAPAARIAEAAPPPAPVPSSLRAPSYEKASVLILDDFEGPLRWKPIAWSNANDSTISLSGSAEGKVLVIRCLAGPEAKAGASLALPEALDMSAWGRMVLDLDLESDIPVRVAVGFMTDAYYESPQRELKPGVHKAVEFDLTTRKFKTSPDWKHNSRLGGLTSLKEVLVVFYTREARKVRLDNVKFLR